LFRNKNRLSVRRWPQALISFADHGKNIRDLLYQSAPKAMKQLSIFIVIAAFSLNVFSQKHKFDHSSIAVTTLHTNLPFGSFSSLFTREFHPGIEIGTGFNWTTKKKHDWFQTVRLGYSYQRFVQHTIPIYSELGYRYKFFKTFSAEAAVGAGYLDAIPAQKIFSLQDDGTYKKKTNAGRPQAMASLSIGIDQKIAASETTLFLNYQQRLQFPFIRSYVPLLPANIMMLGVQFPVR
jgi:hypothetical protein